MINFFIPEQYKVIDYDNVNESKIWLRKINGIYFLIYEFRKFECTHDTKIYYAVLWKFMAEPHSNWKTDYVLLEGCVKHNDW